MMKKILYLFLFGYVTYIVILLINLHMSYPTIASTVPRRIDDNFVSFLSSLSMRGKSNKNLDEINIERDKDSISLGHHPHLRYYKAFSSGYTPMQLSTTEKPKTELFPPRILIWNSTSPMFEENEVECNKEVIKVTKATISVCLRESKDVFTDFVKSTKSFKCPVSLFKLWNQQVVVSHGIYVEIGAGIGNCLLHFLYYNIHSIAFEPVPQNLYLLTKSILMNDKSNKNNRSMKDFLTLYGNALGGYTRHGYIYSDSENWMNSTMNKRINTTNPIANNMVDIFRLDSIINDTNYEKIGNISLLNIDANGYEYHILTGAVKLLSKKYVKSIYCKIDCDKLMEFNVDVEKLFSFLEERKFEIENRDSCTPGLVYNMIARLRL